VELKLTKFGTQKSNATSIKVSEAVFNAEYNPALIHQVVTTYLTNARSGSKAQKTRAEVRGGGVKPWRQKGTGRARAGTIRSPIWRGGGVTFAARPKVYDQKINKKMYSGAMRSILSELIRQERLILVNDFSLASCKSKEAKNQLKTAGLDNVLIVVDEMDENLYLATRNLPNIYACDHSEVNPPLLLNFNQVMMTEGALKKLEEKLK
jgi:large subunit ribosomal protein L4